MDKKLYEKPQLFENYETVRRELADIKMNAPNQGGLYRVNTDELKEEDYTFYLKLKAGSIKNKEEFKRHRDSISARYGEHSNSYHFAADFLAGKVTEYLMTQ